MKEQLPVPLKFNVNLFFFSSFPSIFCFFFFNYTATPEIYPLSLPDAPPICARAPGRAAGCGTRARRFLVRGVDRVAVGDDEPGVGGPEALVVVVRGPGAGAAVAIGL